MWFNNPILALMLCISPFTVAATADYDPENGADINEVCAGCHGEYGQGDKAGEYPRLAGQPAAYIARQLHLFRDRKRPNIAMIEYIDERQMPDRDIRDISRHLSEIRLKTKLPPVDELAPDFDAYTRLLESKRLMQIPRAPGDPDKGAKLYRTECAPCHGRTGLGSERKAVPMLTGQYTQYLWRQVKKYRERLRIHDPDEPQDDLLDEMQDTELTDIFAWLSVADD